MAPGMSFHVINPWLDVTELCFLWDGFFNGTADSSHHYELRLSNGARDAHLFSEANIARAWVSTNLFPPNAPFRTASSSAPSMAINMTGTREIQSPNPLSLTSPYNRAPLGHLRRRGIEPTLGPINIFDLKGHDQDSRSTPADRSVATNAWVSTPQFSGPSFIA
ncbi:hypothetical protein L210DRAFT_3506799 [Boletus edulis BED1]|uniref:Uncharacterized protein n=1 Tax=Boletus edulis BED1 TaxID=1328754 RepID=A0AAD4BMG0_BOLED|nr:hypothetical protein L210DRAFT_3506799 [Boletus edulis BED1]